MFRDVFEMYEVVFEVYMEDKLINRQQMQAPKEILMINFVQTAEQIKNDSRPIKLKMIRQEVVWDEFESKEKILNCKIELNNNAMDAWEGARKEK